MFVFLQQNGICQRFIAFLLLSYRIMQAMTNYLFGNQHYLQLHPDFGNGKLGANN